MRIVPWLVTSPASVSVALNAAFAPCTHSVWSTGTSPASVLPPCRIKVDGPLTAALVVSAVLRKVNVPVNVPPCSETEPPVTVPPESVNDPPLSVKLPVPCWKVVETVSAPSATSRFSELLMLWTVDVAWLYRTVGVPLTLMVTSSSVPGTWSVFQLKRSCHERPSPPPSQATADMTMRSSSGSIWRRFLRTGRRGRGVTALLKIFRIHRLSHDERSINQPLSNLPNSDPE